jgi:hypothetical protein
MARRQGALHKPGLVQNWLQRTQLGAFSPVIRKRRRQEEDSVLTPVQMRRHVGCAYENHRRHSPETEEHAETPEAEILHRHGQKQAQRERPGREYRRHEKRARHEKRNDRDRIKKGRLTHPEQERQHRERPERQKLGKGLATGQDMMSRFNADLVHRHRLTVGEAQLKVLDVLAYIGQAAAAYDARLGPEC